MRGPLGTQVFAAQHVARIAQAAAVPIGASSEAIHVERACATIAGTLAAVRDCVPAHTLVVAQDEASITGLAAIACAAAGSAGIRRFCARRPAATAVRHVIGHADAIAGDVASVAYAATHSSTAADRGTVKHKGARA